MADVRVAAVSQHSENAAADGNRTSFVSDDRSVESPVSRVFPISYATPERLQRAVEPLLTEGIGTVRATSDGPRDGENGNGTARRSLIVRDYPAVLQEVGRALTEIDRPAPQRLLQLRLLQVAHGEVERPAVDFELLRRRQLLGRVRGVATQCPSGSPSAPAGTATLKFGLLRIVPDEMIDALRGFGPVTVVGEWTTLVDPQRECRLTLVRRDDQAAALFEKGGSVPADGATRLGLCPAPAEDGSTRVGVRYLMPLPVDPAAKTPAARTREARAVVILPPGGTLLVGGLAPRGSLAAGAPAADVDSGKPLELLAIVQFRDSGDDAAQRDSAALDPQQRDAHGQLAKHYHAAAQSAAAAGKAADAEWLVACALRFDPSHRDAAELRNALWLSQAPMAFAACDGALAGVSTAPLDGPAIASWLLDDILGRRDASRSVAPTGYSQSPLEIVPGPVAP